MPTRFLTIFCVAVFAWALLSAGIAAAQEDTTEETTALAADAANHRVEAKTDNVSVEVDNGKGSAKTSNVSTANETTSQQSSLTVQQNQADEGSGSQANTGDVNTNQNDAGCQNPRSVRTFRGSENQRTDTFSIEGETFRLRYETAPEGQDPFLPTVDVDVLNENGQSIGEGFIAFEGEDGSENILAGPGTFRLEIRVDEASYVITVEDCGDGGGQGGGGQGGGGQGGGGQGGGDGNNRNNDGGAADKQYGKAEVIVRTVPDKGQLAATGGVPLVGVALLALASVGLGLAILRYAIRRDP